MEEQEIIIKLPKDFKKRPMILIDKLREGLDEETRKFITKNINKILEKE